MRKKRHIVAIELSPEADAAVERLRERTKRTKKDIISQIITKTSMWDDVVLSLILETAPPSLIASEEFWAQTQAKLIDGMLRCRAKYVKGA